MRHGRVPRAPLFLLGIISAWSSSANAQRLELGPKQALVDERVGIRVTGLGKGQVIVVRASRPDSAGRLWQSYAGFRADANGVVDLEREPPANGSYRGIQPMGLFSSMD